MDAIPPIHETDEAHLVHGLVPTSSQNPLVEKANLAQYGIRIDHVRLQRDTDYFLKTMRHILEKARKFYQALQYNAAQEIYEQFFRYLRVYRDKDPTNQVNFYPALFEYAWLKEIQGERQEAQAIINQELLRTLEPVLQPSKQPHLEEIREIVRGLQNQGLFPTVTNLKPQVPLETLEKIAQHFIAVGMQPLALEILGHIEVRHLLSLYRTRQLVHKLEQLEESAPSTPYSVLPSAYAHFGVPVAPILPITPEDAEKIREKTPKRDYRIDRVEPVYAVNKDPREKEKRRRKQSQKGSDREETGMPAKAKKSPNLNPKRKPRITL